MTYENVELTTSDGIKLRCFLLNIDEVRARSYIRVNFLISIIRTRGSVPRSLCSLGTAWKLEGSLNFELQGGFTRCGVMY